MKQAILSYFEKNESNKLINYISLINCDFEKEKAYILQDSKYLEDVISDNKEFDIFQLKSRYVIDDLYALKYVRP